MMKFFTRIAVLFHVTLTLFVCCFLSFFALRMLNVSDVNWFLSIVYADEGSGPVVLSIAGLMFIMNFVFFKIFFFSSRRRHTRLVSDWSSDVCSSDLMIRHTRLVSDWSSDVCSSD